MQLLEKTDEITEIEIQDILEISLVDNPAVPEAKFLVVKRAEDVEEELKEEEEVSKRMDIEKILKSFKRKLKTLKKIDSLEEIHTKIDKIIEAIDTILEEGSEYGYPAPEEVVKSIDNIDLTTVREDNTKQDIQEELKDIRNKINEISEKYESIKSDLDIIANALLKTLKGGQ